MDQKEKQKLYILFGIFGLSFLMIYFNFLLKPQFSSFLVANRDYSAIKSRVRSANALIANESRIRIQYENLKNESQAIEKRLPSQDEISIILQDFSKIAESAGVKILRIKPLEVLDEASQSAHGAGQFFSEYPILIEARAGYHQCGLFVNKLENMERFIRIDAIDIKGRQTDLRHHDIRLRVNTYVTR